MLAEQRRVLQTAMRDAFEDGGAVSIPQSAVDPRGLRGVPVVGVRGVSGASPGTNPESETIRRAEQARR